MISNRYAGTPMEQKDKDMMIAAKEAWEKAQRDHDLEVHLLRKEVNAQKMDDLAKRIKETEAKIQANIKSHADSRILHPSYYGGRTDPYEAIKVIEAWELNFNLGQVLKYIKRAGNKLGSPRLEDLRKAAWYLDREIQRDDGTLPLPYEGLKGNVASALGGLTNEKY